MSISPNIPSPEESYRYESTGTPRWIAVLFVVLIAALAVFGYFGYSIESKLSQDLSKQQDQNKILTAQLDQANTRIADLKSKVEITVQRVGLTQSELAQANALNGNLHFALQIGDARIGLVQLRGENLVLILLLGEVLAQLGLDGIAEIAKHGQRSNQDDKENCDPARRAGGFVAIGLLRAWYVWRNTHSPSSEVDVTPNNGAKWKLWPANARLSTRP